MQPVAALENFRANVRRTIEECNISQRDLAERAKLSVVHVNRILVEKAEPSLPVCESIAQALYAPLERFLVAPKFFKIPRELLLQSVKA